MSWTALSTSVVRNKKLVCDLCLRASTARVVPSPTGITSEYGESFEG